MWARGEIGWDENEGIGFRGDSDGYTDVSARFRI
jgi:hypothetical protein